MTISPGQMIEVEARTFRPNALVWFFLGNPARLPLAESLKQADEFGVFRVTLRVSASAQPGTHPYFANGERADGMRMQFSGWLTVVPAPPTAVTQAGSAAPEADAGESLPRTGTGSLNLGVLGTALVAGGWLLTTVSSRHRNRLESRTSGPADPTT
jgi:LPXTG-motif cell wall-anchored protein